MAKADALEPIQEDIKKIGIEKNFSPSQRRKIANQLSRQARSLRTQSKRPGIDTITGRVSFFILEKVTAILGWGVATLSLGSPGTTDAYGTTTPIGERIVTGIDPVPLIRACIETARRIHVIIEKVNSGNAGAKTVIDGGTLVIEHTKHQFEWLIGLGKNVSTGHDILDTFLVFVAIFGTYEGLSLLLRYIRLSTGDTIPDRIRKRILGG